MRKKISYAQSQALEKAQAAKRANDRRRVCEAELAPELTSEQKAAWEAKRKEALKRYREKKAALGGGDEPPQDRLTLR